MKILLTPRERSTKMRRDWLSSFRVSFWLISLGPTRWLARLVGPPNCPVNRRDFSYNYRAHSLVLLQFVVGGLPDIVLIHLR